LENPYSLYTLDEYTDIICEIMDIIPKDVVIHRLTGDGPKELLIEPKWILNKRLVLNTLNKKLNQRLHT